jgi:hypothetical protein
MATVNQQTKPPVGRSEVDPKTRKLLRGFAAVGVTYCRIDSAGVKVLPSRGLIKAAAMEVLQTINPGYKSSLIKRQYHGFRCGNYQADKTGELQLIEP